MENVEDFIDSKTEWGGDLVVLGKINNSISAVMSNADSEFLFEDCLEMITAKRTKEQVVFDIDSSYVLQMIAHHFDDKHDFVFLLIRNNRGPNGSPPKFGKLLDFQILLDILRLNEAVQFGLGFTSTSNGPEKGYSADHFAALKATMEAKNIQSRATLVNFDIALVTNTDPVNIIPELLNFTYFILQSENTVTEKIVNLNMIERFMELGPKDHIFFDVSDELRSKIVNTAGRVGYDIEVAVIGVLVAVKFWRL